MALSQAFLLLTTIASAVIFRVHGATTMSTILLVILLIVALGLIPSAGFHNYGWGPSGIVGVLLVVLLVFVLMGRL